MPDGLLMGADGGDEDAEKEDEGIEADSERPPKVEKRKQIDYDEQDYKLSVKRVVVD
jgi:hypothetical protein